MNQLEIICMGELNSLNASTRLVALDYVLLADDREVRLVCQQTQHDQISVGAVEAVSCIWVVVGSATKVADVVKHLVLALTWHSSVGEHTRLQVLVKWVCIQLELHKEVQLLA